jgi:tripartite-type tricarboxylate transporter receptor subunit TctC
MRGLSNATRAGRPSILGATLIALASIILPVHAQDYPGKPVRITVPYPPGGGMADRVARLLADKLRDKWGQAFIVENRAGAAANIGTEHVAKAPADGYTLLFTGDGPLTIYKSLYAKLPYDPDAFVPVSVVLSSPNLLVVHPKVPATTVQQLIAFARANPDRLNFASNGAGGPLHLSLELFKSMAGVNITHVAYKGVPPALTDLIGGQVDMMFVGYGTVAQHVRAGKLRALAVGTEQRLPPLPDTPTVAEVLPGFTSWSWFGMVAPPKTPPAIANRLSAAIAESLKQPEVTKLLQDLSVEPIGSTPAQMAQLMRQESERWGNVIRTLGVKVE